MNNEQRKDDLMGLEYDDQPARLQALLRKVLGSCNINFLFGAGVNGGAFPFFSKFTDTIEAMNSLGLEGANIEKALAGCDDDSKRDAIRDAFVEEFNSYRDYQLSHQSLENLRRLLKDTHTVVNRAENRHPESKRINIFTLNYDRIVEELLEDCGFFSYTLTSEAKAYLPFNIVGYNTATRTFIPTFAVYKLHGSVDANRYLHSENIIFPGPDKLGSVVTHFYETLFSMKGELLRSNSALFVLGYSWSDDHVNDIIGSAIDNGLTVVFPQFKAGDAAPETFEDKVVLIPPIDPGALNDTTLALAEYFEQAMR